MRHHLDPDRRTPSLQLGASGPVRVSTDDADPTYEPPPFLGFTHVVWSKKSTGEVIAVAKLGPAHHAPDRSLDFTIQLAPKLWQDEGDQA